MRSLTIELREIEIDALIRSGFLEGRSRDDSNAVNHGVRPTAGSVAPDRNGRDCRPRCRFP
jgi:hypothetical protein